MTIMSASHTMEVPVCNDLTDNDLISNICSILSGEQSILQVQLGPESDAQRVLPPKVTIPEPDVYSTDEELPVSSPTPNGYAALSDSYLSPSRDSSKQSTGTICSLDAL